MKLLYNIGIGLYGLAIRLAAPFNEKASLLVKGRANSKNIMTNYKRGFGKTVWFHAASLGEFEQGRPVMEALKRANPATRIVLTFFSPSGYEVRKNYTGADVILYLPSDIPMHVNLFLDTFRPDAAVIVKYEYWYNYITSLKKRGIPTYLISAIFLPSQPFFKWWGGLYREMLGCFKQIFVQDEASLKLLNGIGIQSAVVTGDTRFDRVKEIADEAKNIPLVESFLGNSPAVVCGSTWPPDEDNLMAYINNYSGNYKWILAPHEIGEAHVAGIISKCKKRVARFTQAPQDIAECEVLIIDCIGLLSAIYRYGKVSYIGGGFGVGIHNTLEAAVYGIPVIFGPNHKKFNEALDLLACGGAFTYSSAYELSELLDTLLAKPSIAQAAGNEATKYVVSKLGATKQIVAEL